jgi:hypothetical protein
MVERGGRARFLLKSEQSIFIVSEGSREHFDGNFAIETSITSAIDLTHPARAEFADYSVVRDCL